MKSLHSISALFLVVFAALFITACKNKCGSIVCQNQSTCQENVCVCVRGYGYYGNSCQTSWSDPLIGTYNCTRSDCKPLGQGAETWVSSVARNSTNGFTVNISNFDNSNTTISGTVDSATNGVNRITIQPAAGTLGINASGTYSNGVINLKFTTTTAAGPGYTCNMKMVKQ